MDSNAFEIEGMFENTYKPKEKQLLQNDKIEPWKDEPQTIPP